MRTVTRSALLPYSAEQMFDVVNDVRAYPGFLPGCESATVHHESAEELVATLTLAGAGLRQSFTTRNRLNRPDRITLTLEEGPFRQLQGEWRFTQLGDAGCKVEMTLAFDMKSGLLAAGFGKVFEAIADRLVGAFSKRADQLHG